MYGTEYDNDIEHLGTSLEFPLVPDLVAVFVTKEINIISFYRN